jgi:probable F420-dependent oxidoreductase
VYTLPRAEDDAFVKTKLGLAVENFTPAHKDPDIDAVVAAARRAEELGFDSVWAWDHMFLGTKRPFPFLESLSTLLVLARETTSVELGTGVLVLPLRNPAVLAKTAATLDIVSEGRLTLGMAAGWYEREFDACGIPFKRRGRIFEENLHLLKEFWRGEPVSGEADGIPFRNAVMLPRPAKRPRPKLLVGGYVDKVLKRAATKSDGWLTYFYAPDDFRRSWARIQEHAEEAGRDPAELENVAQLALCIGDSFEAADRDVRAYIDDYFDLPEWSDATAESAIRGTPEQCAEQFAEHVDAGVQHICLVPYGYDPEQVERFAAEVMPLLDKQTSGTAS